MSDSARLQALFALDWEYTMVDAPELATVVGAPGQDDRWTDYSLAAIRRRRDELPRSPSWSCAPSIAID